MLRSVSAPLSVACLLLPFATLTAEVEDDLTLGIETVTGFRSDYVYRGFKLADATLEAQVATEVALGEDRYLAVSAWHLAESSDNFSETGLGLALLTDWEDFRFGVSLDYRAYSGTFFDDGIDLGLEAFWHPSADWKLGAEAHYDFGAEGSYFAFEGGWSKPLNKDLFLAAETGVSVVSDYYERDGFNDFYGRLSLTYNVNSFLSLTPFVGYSVALADEASDEIFAGLWLAVSF